MRASLLLGAQMKFSLEVTSANIMFLRNLGCVFDLGASLFRLTGAANRKTLEGFNFVFFFIMHNLQVLQPLKYVFWNLEEITLDKGKHFVPPTLHCVFLLHAPWHGHLICYHILEHFSVTFETVSQAGLLEPEFFKHEAGLWINLRHRRL